MTSESSAVSADFDSLLMLPRRRSIQPSPKQSRECIHPVPIPVDETSLMDERDAPCTYHHARKSIRMHGIPNQRNSHEYRAHTSRFFVLTEIVPMNRNNAGVFQTQSTRRMRRSPTEYKARGSQDSISLNIRHPVFRPNLRYEQARSSL